jgi:hypothetical protein
MPPKPIGQKEKTSIVLGSTLRATIQLEGVAVPLHHTAFVRGEGAPGLFLSKTIGRKAVSWGVRTKGKDVPAGAQEAVLAEGFLAD